MPLLSREHFVDICNRAILKTREKISINNQLSGYKKYYQEITQRDYFSKNVRAPLGEVGEHAYIYRHDLIEHVGLGNCHELADYLLVEIGKEIDYNRTCARIRIVKCNKMDHVYLEIRIKLEGELDYSLWEVDAWDPRIIDISTRPDGSIKNHESLAYGYSVKARNSIYTSEIDYRKRYSFFRIIPKPIAGEYPFGDSSSEPLSDVEMLDENKYLYSDYTIDESMDEGKLDPSGELHYLQQCSSWQR